MREPGLLVAEQCSALRSTGLQAARTSVAAQSYSLHIGAHNRQRMIKPNGIDARRDARLVCAAICAVIAGAASVSADQLIDDFDQGANRAPWTFSNGPEFPGATGSLGIDKGHSGKGACLAYDLSRGGHYVSANLSFPLPVAASAISFWVKSPLGILVGLRVQDSSGQTLQYQLRRPQSATEEGAWYQQMVGLDSPDGWWGGGNDGRLHNPIKGLSILAGYPLQPHAAGAIDFDDVAIRDSTDFRLDPVHQKLIPGPASAGELLPALGVNIHFTRDDRALDAAKSAGFSWIRMDLAWSAVETQPGIYRWTDYDNLITALAQRGMRALLIFDYGNPLYTGAYNLPPTTAAAVQAFGNFAEAASRHFAGRKVRFEVWNEPNIKGFWPPIPNPDQYAALGREAIRRVHAGDPNAEVATGGLSGFDFHFLDGYLNENGARDAEAIGVHPYDCNPPEMLGDRLLLWRSIASRHFKTSPPTWDTEWGFSSASFGNGHSDESRRRQAVLVARELLCACAAGFPLIVYYDVRDDGNNPTDTENNFGLLANDYSEKPAMKAVRTLTGIARNHRFSGFIQTTASGLHAMRFDGSTGPTAAVWNSAATGTVKVSFSTNSTVVDFLGNRLTPVNGSGDFTCVLSQTSGPVYISFPNKQQIDGR